MGEWDISPFTRTYIYIVFRCLHKKTKTIKSFNDLGKTAKSTAQKYSVRIKFFLPFQILYTVLGYMIAKFSPQNVSWHCA